MAEKKKFKIQLQEPIILLQKSQKMVRVSDRESLRC